MDLAQRQSERFTERALQEHRKRNERKGPGSETCLECGEVIPQARRDLVAGCEFCVACQQVLEAGLKGGI